jgi:hypothetical protein
VANHLEPELVKAKEKLGDLAKDDFDLLIYTASTPHSEEKFLKWKYGIEKMPILSSPRPLMTSGRKMRQWQRLLNRFARHHLNNIIQENPYEKKGYSGRRWQCRRDHCHEAH